MGQEFSWSPSAVLTALPDVAPWTRLGGSDDLALFFAGAVSLALFSTDTANYRDNLSRDEPKLWVVMRAVDDVTPLEIVAITADPTEGEAFTETGSYIVETIAMPDDIAGPIAQFIHDHHVERPIIKRKRDRAAPDIRWEVRPGTEEETRLRASLAEKARDG